jgi:hypothetical protein
VRAGARGEAVPQRVAAAGQVAVARARAARVGSREGCGAVRPRAPRRAARSGRVDGPPVGARGVEGWALEVAQGWVARAGVARAGVARGQCGQAASEFPVGHGPALDPPVFLADAGRSQPAELAHPALNLTSVFASVTCRSARSCTRSCGLHDGDAPNFADLVRPPEPNQQSSGGLGRSGRSDDAPGGRFILGDARGYYAAAPNSDTATSATWVGVRPTLTPLASSASALAAAVPREPETIAPAWPIVLPGGAVNPAM